VAQFTTNYSGIEFFTQKLSLSSQKYEFGIRDPGSEIRKKPIRDTRFRSKKKHRIPDSGSRIRIRNTGIPDPEHWRYILMNLLGDHILVAKAPGHHGDEQNEEGTESRIRIQDTGDTS
jgi:hypothetical protein